MRKCTAGDAGLLCHGRVVVLLRAFVMHDQAACAAAEAFISLHSSGCSNCAHCRDLCWQLTVVEI